MTFLQLTLPPPSEPKAQTRKMVSRSPGATLTRRVAFRAFGFQFLIAARCLKMIEATQFTVSPNLPETHETRASLCEVGMATVCVPPSVSRAPSGVRKNELASRGSCSCYLRARNPHLAIGPVLKISNREALEKWIRFNDFLALGSTCSVGTSHNGSGVDIVQC